MFLQYNDFLMWIVFFLLCVCRLTLLVKVQLTMVALVGSSFDFCFLDLQMTTAYTTMELKAKTVFVQHV